MNQHLDQQNKIRNLFSTKRSRDYFTPEKMKEYINIIADAIELDRVCYTIDNKRIKHSSLDFSFKLNEKYRGVIIDKVTCISIENIYINIFIQKLICSSDASIVKHIVCKLQEYKNELSCKFQKNEIDMNVISNIKTFLLRIFVNVLSYIKTTHNIPYTEMIVRWNNEYFKNIWNTFDNIVYTDTDTVYVTGDYYKIFNNMLSDFDCTVEWENGIGEILHKKRYIFNIGSGIIKYSGLKKGIGIGFKKTLDI